jgi:hypothetical protein
MSRLRTITFKDGGGNFYDYFDAYYNALPHFDTGVAGMDSPCLHVTSWNGAKIALGSSKNDIWVSLRVKVAATNSSRIVTFATGTTTLAQLMLNTYTKVFTAFKGSLGTWLAASTTMPQVNDVFHIKIYYHPDATAGNFKVWINGLLEIDYSGSTSTGSTLDAVWLGPCQYTGVAEYYYDRIIVAEEDIDPVVFGLLAPNGAGNSSQWTPLPDPNWDAVNEIPFVDSDHNKSDAADEVDTYATGNLASDVDDVKAVTVFCRGWKESVPTPTQVKPVVRVSSTNYLGTAKTLTPFPLRFEQRWESNPNTVAPWENSEVDAMEIGIQSV